MQWSVVRVTVVSVTVGYSDSFGNPLFITNKTPLLTVTPRFPHKTLILQVFERSYVARM